MRLPDADEGDMNPERRSMLAIVLMAVGLIALIIGGVSDGWSALAAIGIACFAVAIGAQLAVLRRTRS